MFKKICFGIMLLLSQLVGLYALALLALPQFGHPALIERLSESPLSMVSHFVGSGLALIIGPYLFLARSRIKLWVHRYLGRIYMLGVLFGGVASCYMSVNADGGLPAQTGFFALAILWLTSGFLAFHYIRTGRVQQHQTMMFINFALTFAAVTLRIYLPIGALSGAAFDTYYGLIAWMCWVPNLLVALLVMPGNLFTNLPTVYGFGRNFRGQTQ